ncbi:MAG: hypothetical protein A3C35_04750 [Omnitrophica bacterium RIFCSPHIGHO2_02_FULL_46_11]|nr:MAG: hypothetical protein A3C35_04750 [Omnitrophica bacterium RIFCSPHIGHO2_02_FULL_46_11]OGW87750.1 MAG: hypothetical protein A3A81_01445 [Omnitrophica bacterium RIFCSPLOWO2_01_FULL_45_10b]
MKEKEFMIAALRKQRDLLNGLVSELRSKRELDRTTSTLYDRVTKQVEQDLKKLRKLRREVF